MPCLNQVFSGFVYLQIVNTFTKGMLLTLFNSFGELRTFPVWYCVIRLLLTSAIYSQNVKAADSLLPYTVGSCFATVRFRTIHFYDPCPVGPSTPDLWCITAATQASFLYLVRFYLFSGVHVFLLFLL